jgi:hypothetical protein
MILMYGNVDILSPLVEQLRGGSDECRTEVAMTLVVLVTADDDIAVAIVAAGALPPLGGIAARRLVRGQGECCGGAGEP